MRAGREQPLSFHLSTSSQLDCRTIDGMATSDSPSLPSNNRKGDRPAGWLHTLAFGVVVAHLIAGTDLERSWTGSIVSPNATRAEETLEDQLLLWRLFSLREMAEIELAVSGWPVLPHDRSYRTRLISTGSSRMRSLVARSASSPAHMFKNSFRTPLLFLQCSDEHPSYCSNRVQSTALLDTCAHNSIVLA